tara:strand:+ start:3380 stop:4174 length:795 start_codon:yes stop_codon:yes gene_type:complete
MSYFFSNKESKITNRYLQKGYVISKVNNLESLEWINQFFKEKIRKKIKINIRDDHLNEIHKHVSPKNLNNFRLEIINDINKSKSFKKHYYNVAYEYLNILVGNELVMQKSINLSIQMPNDKSSLLEMHADTWSGDSPYEIVVWLPLVDCFKTKSMYILPTDKYELFLKKFKSSHSKKNFDLFKSIKKDLIWLDIKFGEVLLFNQCLPHGNVINKENETRWSMNCRFKSIFTPYGDKKIGEFFQPITLRAASRIGMKYQLPDSKS